MGYNRCKFIFYSPNFLRPRRPRDSAPPEGEEDVSTNGERGALESFMARGKGQTLREIVTGYCDADERSAGEGQVACVIVHGHSR